jgi:hypothetical protein
VPFLLMPSGFCALARACGCSGSNTPRLGTCGRSMRNCDSYGVLDTGETGTALNFKNYCSILVQYVPFARCMVCLNRIF